MFFLGCEEYHIRQYIETMHCIHLKGMHVSKGKEGAKLLGCFQILFWTFNKQILPVLA